jgi:hypothetical protein
VRKNLWGKFRYHRSFGTKKLKDAGRNRRRRSVEPITGGSISILKQIGRLMIRPSNDDVNNVVEAAIAG